MERKETEPMQVFDNAGLFGADGHLTEPGLAALCAGTLDELGGLEAAEHLTFCDACLARYSELLGSTPLAEPVRDPVPPVQSALRRRGIRVFTNRYVTVAAAVLLAFTLWNVGAFTPVRRSEPNPAQQPGIGISQVFSGAFQQAQSALDGWIGSLQAGISSGLSQLSDKNIKGE